MYRYHRCLWTPTRDDYDCSQLWEEPANGCCAGDNEQIHRARCSVTESASSCDRMASCHWVETDDPTECEWDGGEVEYGCCVIGDPTNILSRWFDKCPLYWTEGDCTRPTDNASGLQACTWSPTTPDFDCAAIWPTAAPETGCCAGDNEQIHRARCVVTETASACDRMSSCHWVPGDDADCEWDGGEQEAGCCFISGWICCVYYTFLVESCHCGRIQIQYYMHICHCGHL